MRRVSQIGDDLTFAHPPPNLNKYMVVIGSEKVDNIKGISVSNQCKYREQQKWAVFLY